VAATASLTVAGLGGTRTRSLLSAPVVCHWVLGLSQWSVASSTLPMGHGSHRGHSSSASKSERHQAARTHAPGRIPGDCRSRPDSAPPGSAGGAPRPATASRRGRGLLAPLRRRRGRVAGAAGRRRPGSTAPGRGRTRGTRLLQAVSTWWESSVVRETLWSVIRVRVPGEGASAAEEW
jgi:hypothetical protein